MSLDQVRERWAAATPGPWFREYSDVITNDPDPRDTEEGYDDPRSLRIVQGAPHLNKRDPQGINNATAIANAPTDVGMLLGAVDAVLKLHTPIDAAMFTGRNGVHKVQVCTGCGTDDGNWQRFPCPTVRAITAALDA